ncbi:glycosyltransferase family 2 protein [Desulfomicrobium escambiense]|uniref:glycosyltransferase family 2 protein n=1 Tax=Desulfomicrobium escambiense TaxID=29503 RepID=UPI00041A59B1|nr:glycosyltransferase family 2 protein [Desulfomicrobium escambiense]
MTALAVTIVFLLAYPYAVYPLVLAVASRALPVAQPPVAEGSLPSVSVLLSVFNEESTIHAKMENVMTLDYPADRLELVVVSDGSTDRTEDLIRAYTAPNVRLLVQAREGKTSALNRAAASSRSDLLVFTDANAFFRPDALRRLTAPFFDHGVGLVSGRVLPLDPGTRESGFGRFESFLKERESRLGVIAGADGAIYALRRNLYRPLPPFTINDFHHPWSVALQGLRSRFAPDAVAREETEGDLEREVSRQKRMVNQALLVARDMLPRLLAQGRFLAAWVLVSHKILRWLHFPLLLLFLAWAAAFGSWPILAAAAAYPAMFAAIHARIRRHDLPRAVGVLYRFQLVHFAYLLGAIDHLRGRRAVTWNPRGGA